MCMSGANMPLFPPLPPYATASFVLVGSWRVRHLSRPSRASRASLKECAHSLRRLWMRSSGNSLSGVRGGISEVDGHGWMVPPSQGAGAVYAHSSTEYGDGSPVTDPQVVTITSSTFTSNQGDVSTPQGREPAQLRLPCPFSSPLRLRPAPVDSSSPRSQRLPPP